LIRIVVKNIRAVILDCKLPKSTALIFTLRYSNRTYFHICTR